jgi:hypothetical protein
MYAKTQALIISVQQMVKDLTSLPLGALTE